MHDSVVASVSSYLNIEHFALNFSFGVKRQEAQMVCRLNKKEKKRYAEEIEYENRRNVFQCDCDIH